MIHLLTAIG